MKYAITQVSSFFKKNRFIIILLSACALPTILPLLHAGFFVTDDGEWMVIRLSAFYSAIHDGQFPVRFLHRLNFDYGYPVSTFLYPGFLYAGVFFKALKISSIETIKLLFGISLLGSSIFTYFWLTKVFKQRLASFVGAVIALYIPYHLYDLYFRGSVGELFALLWIPFILWMMERKNKFFTSLGLFVLILSHNTLAALFVPFLFLYALSRRLWNFKELLLTFFFGIALSSFFIIPIFFELPLTRFSQTAIANPLQYFADIHLIGISSGFILAASFCLFLFCYRTLKQEKIFISLFFILTMVSIFLSSSLSNFLWHAIPNSFIQFPFRLLSYLVITLPLLVAFSLSTVRGRNQIFLAVVFLGISFYSSLPYLTPAKYFQREPGYYDTLQPTTTIKDEYLPLWVKDKPLMQPPEKLLITKGMGTIENFISTNKKITFAVHAESPVTIQVNTLYWPGWNFFIDGKKTDITSINIKGGMDIIVPVGRHEMQFIFGETSLRLFSDAVTVIAFICLLIFVKFYRVRK